MGNVEMLHGLVTGHDMDSKKTERLSQLLPTQDPVTTQTRIAPNFCPHTLAHMSRLLSHAHIH